MRWQQTTTTCTQLGSSQLLRPERKLGKEGETEEEHSCVTG